MSKQAKGLRIKVESPDGSNIYSLDSRSRFTIGYRPTNTLQMYGENVPAKFELLRSSKDGFHLKVQESMAGEVIAENCPLAISDLIKHRLLPREKDGYVLHLTPEKRAMIRFHHFQFTIEYDGSPQAAGKEIPYWRFSHRVYRRLRSDLLFKSILLLLFALGGYLSYRIHLMPYVVSRKVNVEKYTRHVARIIIHSRPKATPKPASPTEVLSPKGTEKKDTQTPPENTAARDKRKESNAPIRKTVLKKGLLGLIAGEGSSNKESAILESLVDRGLVRELDDILQNTQNLEIELPSMNDISGDLDKLLTTSQLDVNNLISGMEVDDAVELKAKGDVTLESFGDLSGSETALGYRSEQSIRDVILKYENRVIYTYNKYLKLDPELKGKIVIEMVIDASGKVVRCTILESTIHNEKFENELLAVVKQFHFKPIPEGEVTVKNPYIFFRRDS